jgi:hypothetical protein
MLGDTLQHVSQIPVWIDPVEPAGTDQAVEPGCSLATRIGASEEIISTSEHQRTIRARCGSDDEIVERERCTVPTADEISASSGSAAPATNQPWRAASARKADALRITLAQSRRHLSMLEHPDPPSTHRSLPPPSIA